jgi:hypothetical protein
MLCSRRPLWGVLFAALVLFVCDSAAAQQPQRSGRDGELPPHFTDDSPRTPDCGFAGDNRLSFALTAARLGLPGCDATASEARGAFARTPAAVAVRPMAPLGPATQGKKGQAILAARSRALDVLGTENACSEWFRQAQRDPSAAFRTLLFDVDPKAIDYVIERMNGGKSEFFENPYVATVVQDGGEYQTITINAGGAFFRPSASLVRLATEGGPVQYQGARALKVGPYMGNTPQAQVTTLLHELGHLLGLLPLDTHDANGLSAANTAEVLRHCQGEIEASAKRPSLVAPR